MVHDVPSSSWQTTHQTAARLGFRGDGACVMMGSVVVAVWSRTIVLCQVC